MTQKANMPIGIFDSGVGGLTVAHAIKQLLPNEEMIYFGDTFHLPYGDKSSDSVRYYSTKITEFLLERNCKLILIACNTASANAYNTVKQRVNKEALVVNVIDPVVEFVINNYKSSKIGVIGTKGTINSKTYERKIKEFDLEINIVSKATPLFVPMIEEGFIYDDISNAIIRSYLSHEELQGIGTLILGCTHYPIIKNQISRYYNFNVNVVDSAKIVAKFLKNLLTENKMLCSGNKNNHSFYVSDYTENFEIISKMFFEEEVRLQKIDLWK